MSKVSKKVATSQLTKEKMYPTEKLLKSKHLAGYQKDFAKAILNEPAYSIKDAKLALDTALKGNAPTHS
ncbi:MAG: hypothetical protein HFG53_12055 [Lachnospiraceae bacterium]|jgi:hypothetical protein|nr:hypothetical protein [Lachnospiraceae bacterium]